MRTRTQRRSSLARCGVVGTDASMAATRKKRRLTGRQIAYLGYQTQMSARDRICEAEDWATEDREIADPTELQRADIRAIVEGRLGCNAEGHDEMDGPVLPSCDFGAE